MLDRRQQLSRFPETTRLGDGRATSWALASSSPVATGHRGGALAFWGVS